MLLLHFILDGARYALNAEDVDEVMPFRSADNPAGERLGFILHRGAPLPVIDLSQILLRRPAAPMATTRLVIVHYEDAGQPRRLALVAERTVGLQRCETADTERGAAAGAAYVHLVSAPPLGWVNLIDVAVLANARIDAAPPSRMEAAL